MNNWLQKIEPYAKLVVWIFGIIMAGLAVATVLPLLIGNILYWVWIAVFFIFLIAALAVFLVDVRHLFHKQPSTKEEYAERSASIAHPSRNKWITIGVVVLAVIILVPIIARQLLPVPQEYQAFLTAFAATGAWVTGIALALFTYQQYKLRQAEHNLLFEPQVLLTSGNISTTGLSINPFLKKPEPFRISWTVFIQNTSNIPILIEHMQVYVKLDGEDSKKQASLTPTYCEVSEPASLSMPFEVTRTKAQRVVWVVEGSAGDTLNYVSGDSGKRDFVLIFRIFAKNPQNPKGSFLSEETLSWPIHIPQDANWVSKTPFLDIIEKQKGDETT